jgi:hypothetical protein
MITCHDAERLQSLSKTHVITENAMKMVLVQEVQPVDTFLLVRSQFCFDCHRNCKWLNLMRIEQLSDESSFAVTAFEKFFR